MVQCLLRMKLVMLTVGYEEGCITPEAADLITKLLNPDPVKRLGSSGVHQIKNHNFFKGLYYV